MRYLLSFIYETREFWWIAAGVMILFGYISGRGMKDEKGKGTPAIQMIHLDQIWEILSSHQWYFSFIVILLGGSYVVLLVISILGIIFH